MDKKTVLAFVLLAFLFTWFMGTQSQEVQQKAASVAENQENFTGSSEIQMPSTVGSITTASQDELIPLTHYNASTEVYDIEFSNYGASITSLKLKNFKEDNQTVEMVLKSAESDPLKEQGAFLLYFGSNNNGVPFYGPFVFSDEGNGVYKFTASASFVNQNGETIPLTVVKTYEFLPDEYLFKVDVELIQPNGDYLPLNFNGYSYTLESAPQMGPVFTKLDGRAVYRKNSYLVDGKRREMTIKNGMAVNDERVTWAGVVEKYFAFVGIPDSSTYRQIWTDRPLETVNGPLPGNQFAFVRNEIKNAKNLDSFYFYVGPKQENILAKYNSTNSNGFKISNVKLTKVMDEAKILYPVEALLTILLKGAYRIVPNWGWAILLVTLFVKLVLVPLTLKSMISTSRMGELAPKLKKIQEQYKDKPQEMQQAQMKLYQQEGINPMAGCLPILLQMPILLAMYGLFNKYFEFRGAPFISWITDLSAPDSVYHFSKTLPLLNWTDIRLLPAIYLVSQLIMNKITQTDQTAQNQQMKMMMNLMPVLFFFILYDMPSGLLVYWIASNIFSMLQQIVVNELKKHGKLGFAKTPAKNKK